MFYCNKCGKERNWPTDTFIISIGTCEICGEKTRCNDIQSKLLPIPPKIDEAVSILQRKIKRLERRVTILETH